MALKSKVAIAERNDLGGVCINQGCIPKKLMVYAADSAQLVQNLVSYRYIGVEFASIFCGLGTEVVLINQGDGILNGFDDDLRHAVQQRLCQRGITLLPNAQTDAIQPVEQGFQICLQGDSTKPPNTLMVDLVLCATGRTPNLDNLDLGKAEVEIKDGAIAVDAYSRTNQSHVFAGGDFCRWRLYQSCTLNSRCTR